MFETEIPARKMMRNRHRFLYLVGVHLALAAFYSVFFFTKPNFNRGYWVVLALAQAASMFRAYRNTVDEPEQTKTLDI